MVRPVFGTEEYLTWNEVFNACEELLGHDSVIEFFVARHDWTIEKAGGVRVIFRDIDIELQGEDGPIEFQGPEVRVQLIGDQFDFDNPGMEGQHPFLPALGNTSVFVLGHFGITGSPVRGTGAIKSCRGSDGGGELDPSSSTLEITTSAPE